MNLLHESLSHLQLKQAVTWIVTQAYWLAFAHVDMYVANVPLAQGFLCLYLSAYVASDWLGHIYTRGPFLESPGKLTGP